jgi:hypothetical protein
MILADGHQPLDVSLKYVNGTDVLKSSYETSFHAAEGKIYDITLVNLSQL